MCFGFQSECDGNGVDIINLADFANLPKSLGGVGGGGGAHIFRIFKTYF